MGLFGEDEEETKIVVTGESEKSEHPVEVLVEQKIGGEMFGLLGEPGETKVRLVSEPMVGTPNGAIVDVLTSEQAKRKAFLEERKTGIGGSDAAVVAGLNPYKTAYELWLEKTGQIAEQDLSDNKAVVFGNKLESLTIEWFAEKKGFEVDTSDACKALKRSAEHPIMICHLDGRVWSQNAIVEAKTAGPNMHKHWGPEDSDHIPESYIIQCQHNMYITSTELAYVPVMALWARDVLIYEVQRNDSLIVSLIELEEDFWAHVLDGTPPEMDFSNAHALDAVKRIYPGTNGQIMQFDLDMFQSHLLLEKTKAEKKIIEELEDGLKARLQFSMGECAIGLFPDQTGYVRSQRDEAQVAYTRKAYIDFRFSKKPGGKK